MKQSNKYFIRSSWNLQTLKFRNSILHFKMSLLYPQLLLQNLNWWVNYIRTLRSSNKSLKEQLENAKKKEAAFIVTFAKREQEVAELKIVLHVHQHDTTAAHQYREDHAAAAEPSKHSSLTQSAKPASNTALQQSSKHPAQPDQSRTETQ